MERTTCVNDECGYEATLPQVIHPIFGDTGPSYHDLAHLYSDAVLELGLLRQSLAELTEMREQERVELLAIADRVKKELADRNREIKRLNADVSELQNALWRAGR